ncbi:MAG: hypothetical protein ACQESF_06650 [Nanobdellota archaeon]
MAKISNSKKISQSNKHKSSHKRKELRIVGSESFSLQFISLLVFIFLVLIFLYFIHLNDEIVKENLSNQVDKEIYRQIKNTDKRVILGCVAALENDPDYCKLNPDEFKGCMYDYAFNIKHRMGRDDLCKKYMPEELFGTKVNNLCYLEDADDCTRMDNKSNRKLCEALFKSLEIKGTTPCMELDEHGRLGCISDYYYIRALREDNIKFCDMFPDGESNATTVLCKASMTEDYRDCFI